MSAHTAVDSRNRRDYGFYVFILTCAMLLSFSTWDGYTRYVSRQIVEKNVGCVPGDILTANGKIRFAVVCKGETYTAEEIESMRAIYRVLVNNLYLHERKGNADLLLKLECSLTRGGHALCGISAENLSGEQK